jgi:hypothetical protein
MMKIFALLDLDVYAASWTRMKIVEEFGLTSKFDFNIVLTWKVKVRFAWCCLKFDTSIKYPKGIWKNRFIIWKPGDVLFDVIKLENYIDGVVLVEIK